MEMFAFVFGNLQHFYKWRSVITVDFDIARESQTKFGINLPEIKSLANYN